MNTLNRTKMRISMTSIIMVCVLTLSCKAQTVTLNQTTYTTDQMQDGMYLKDMDNILDRFVGTWKWEEGNSSFEIVFTKAEMIEYPNGTFFDLIIGKYKYIENGVLIADNLNENFVELLYPIKGGFSKSNHDKLNIDFHDNIKHKAGSGYFELIFGTNPQQVKWKAWGHSRIAVNGEPENQGFSLPSYEEIILVKQ